MLKDHLVDWWSFINPHYINNRQSNIVIHTAFVVFDARYTLHAKIKPQLPSGGDYKLINII
jgi:hypothetical protein